MFKHGLGVLCLISVVMLQGCGGGGSSSGDSSSNQLTQGNGQGSDQGSNQEPLQAPQLANHTGNDRLVVSWSDSNAQQYRVLYWQGNETPQEFTTSDLTFTSSPLTAGSYQVLVEAYDALGNSLFSAPMMIEVN